VALIGAGALPEQAAFHNASPDETSIHCSSLRRVIFCAIFSTSYLKTLFTSSFASSAPALPNTAINSFSFTCAITRLGIVLP